MGSKEYGGGVSHSTAPVFEATYSAGDVLVTRSEDGSFQVSRVSANGRSVHVMGYQQTEPAALLMASRATSGYQRVFLKTEGASPEYHPVG
jgi:hypothetical protein